MMPRGAALVMLATLGWLLAVKVAHAEAPFQVPVAPSAAPPRTVVDVHGGFSSPLRNVALCPKGAGCVFQRGGNLGVGLERRYPRGLGWMLAYDVWFLDSDSVFELGVQQALRGGARYTRPSDTVLHPVLELSAGAMGYGDTFTVATAGVLLQALAAVEVELTYSFGLVFGVGLRAFSHSPFRTRRDSVERGASEAFSEALFFHIGLTIQ